MVPKQAISAGSFRLKARYLQAVIQVGKGLIENELDVLLSARKYSLKQIVIQICIGMKPF